MIKFGANILSQTVQRNLSRATGDLSTTSERLSSGQRINKASDDAAGLAIAASLNVNSRVFTQGVRNLNDGLSAVNIAEGAMGELGNIIVRIEELASQSISGTYSDTQRKSLQKEATALTAEWNRIVESTSFNGQSLLRGSNTRTVLQGGKGVDATLAIQVGKEGVAGAPEGSAGGTTRVSVSAAGVEGDDESYQVSVSASGRMIAFTSYANNFVTPDGNFLQDVFVRDLSTGAVTRISVTPAGQAAALGGDSPSISADGNSVAFASYSTELTGNDTGFVSDIFLRDLPTSTTYKVSVSSTGVAGNGNSLDPSTSADGRYVVFSSVASNLVSGDVNGVKDIFLHDRLSRTTRAVSVATNGLTGGASDSQASISADGRYVAFTSTGSNIVAGDTNGIMDIFVRDLNLGTTTRVNLNAQGSQVTSGYIDKFQLSADARFIAFDSTSTSYVAGDTNLATDVFVRDLETGTNERISVSSTGAQSNGSTTLFRSISSDGRYVLFSSDATNLVAGDTNGVSDLFLRDRIAGTTTRVNVDSSGQEMASGAVSDADLSANGSQVFFSSSATALVTGDTNSIGDVFRRDLSTSGVQTLAGVVVSNKASAKVTLDLVQEYRAALLDYRSKLGATSSRITTFVSTLQSSAINYKAASSRITDADVAEEAAKSIATGIRQQIATSLLGQANLAPQIGLELLKNA